MAVDTRKNGHKLVAVTVPVLARLFANRLGQHVLESIAKGLMYLMGIGAGAGVNASGEREVLAKAWQNLQPEEKFVVFDVGANKGDYIEMAINVSRMRPLVVHAFEPSSVAFGRLSSRWGLRDDVVLNRLGLGKVAGDRTLYFDRPGSSLASLTKRDLRHVNLEMLTSEDVHIDTLENYCLAHRIPQIDILKVDVEGHELEVFQGASGLLRNGGVRVATFEFGGTDIDTRVYFRDFFHFFRDHSMELYRITPSGYLNKIAKYSEFCEQFRITNFVAIRSPSE